MGLPNFHAVRGALEALTEVRDLSLPVLPRLRSNLSNVFVNQELSVNQISAAKREVIAASSLWLKYTSALLGVAFQIAYRLDKSQAVLALIHCSSGRDRTTQVYACHAGAVDAVSRNADVHTIVLILHQCISGASGAGPSLSHGHWLLSTHRERVGEWWSRVLLPYGNRPSSGMGCARLDHCRSPSSCCLSARCHTVIMSMHCATNGYACTGSRDERARAHIPSVPRCGVADDAPVSGPI